MDVRRDWRVPIGVHLSSNSTLFFFENRFFQFNTPAIGARVGFGETVGTRVGF